MISKHSYGLTFAKSDVQYYYSSHKDIRARCGIGNAAHFVHARKDIRARCGIGNAAHFVHAHARTKFLDWDRRVLCACAKAVLKKLCTQICTEDPSHLHACIFAARACARGVRANRENLTFS